MQVGGGSAPPPQTLGTFAQQVLNALVPNEESILKLAGMAGNGATAGGSSRVPGEGSGGAHLSHGFSASVGTGHLTIDHSWLCPHRRPWWYAHASPIAGPERV